MHMHQQNQIRASLVCRSSTEVELRLEANWAGELNLKLVPCFISLLGCCPAGSLRLVSLRLRACGPVFSMYAICLERSELLVMKEGALLQ